MFKHEANMTLINFRSIEVVGRYSETQLKVGEHINYLIN